MTNAKKLLVTRRRVEFFVLRRRFGFEQFCDGCGTESRFVALEDAMLFSNLSIREIVRRADAGEIHFLESLGGYLVICEKSLPEKDVLALENFANIRAQEEDTEIPALKKL